MKVTGRSITVIDAPSNLGLRPPRPGHAPGVYKMAGALRAQDIVARLKATDAGRIAPGPYSHQLDPGVGVRNHEGIHTFTIQLADRVARLLQSGRFPLVLGGDCSILLGPMLALRRRGRYGLFFIDGHVDFNTPATSQTGGAAGMDLALVTGRGPDLLANLESRKPLVREEDVVAFGPRHLLDATLATRAIRSTAIKLYDLEQVRQMGIGRAVTTGLASLEHRVEGFWIHLDVDVLDNAIMPAVDSPQPGGMSYIELIETLQLLLASEKAVGMEITIFDPELDPDGRLAAELTNAIVESFGGHRIRKES